MLYFVVGFACLGIGYATGVLCSISTISELKSKIHQAKEQCKKCFVRDYENRFVEGIGV
jgi:hypothetical protein